MNSAHYQIFLKRFSVLSTNEILRKAEPHTERPVRHLWRLTNVRRIAEMMRWWSVYENVSDDRNIVECAHLSHTLYKFMNMRGILYPLEASFFFSFLPPFQGFVIVSSSS